MSSKSSAVRYFVLVSAFVACRVLPAQSGVLEGQDGGGGAGTAAPGANPVAVLSTPNTRIVAAVEQSAATAGPSATSLMIDVMTTTPVWNNGGHFKKSGLQGWLDLRLDGAEGGLNSLTVNQIAPLAVGDSAAAGLANVKQSVQGVTVGQIIQGFRMQVGVAVPLSPPQQFEARREYAVESQLIAGLGLSTPLNAKPDSPQVFVFDPSNEVLTSTYPQRTNVVTGDKYKYIAFVPPDRRRLYGEAFVGVRLVTHHYHDENGKKVDATFPGIIDLTVGRNSRITSGVFDGAVGNLNAFYPLPVDNIAAGIFVFAGFEFHFQHVQPSELSTTALFLASAPSDTKLTDATVDIRAINPTDRDQWRIGIGIDAVALVRRLRGTSTSALRGSPPS